MKSAAQMSAARQALLSRYLKGAAPVKISAIRPRPRGIPAPLSLAQEQVYWRELRVAGDPPLYNECITVRMPGTLEPAVLQRAFAEIVRRHEIWRTTFETVAGSPVQCVQPFQSIPFDLIDISHLPQHEREKATVQRMTEKIRRPFQLDRGPLLRPTLIRISDSEHRLYLVAHQIVLDGMSAYRIFPHELAVLYQAFLAGEPSPLADLPIQYADFACWQRESVVSRLSDQVAHWRTRLADAVQPESASSAPPVFPRDAYRGCTVPFSFPQDIGNCIRQLSRSLNTSEFVILITGIACVINRITGESLVRVGTLSPSGRKRTEVMGLLGYFLNPVTLAFDFSSDPGFTGLVRQAQAAIPDAISNDDVPIEHLARELNCHDAGTPSAFFTVCTSLQPPQPPLPFDWQVTTMDIDNGGSPWKFYIAFIDAQRTIIGRAQFNPNIVESAAVQQFLRDLQTTFEQAHARCSSRQKPEGVEVA
jgi:hypothetical protein